MAVEEGSDLDLQMAERVRTNLAPIGITVEIEVLPTANTSGPSTRTEVRDRSDRRRR
jgi:ABC-type transport system substrate-binding protein